MEHPKLVVSVRVVVLDHDESYSHISHDESVSIPTRTMFPLPLIRILARLAEANVCSVALAAHVDPVL